VVVQLFEGGQPSARLGTSSAATTCSTTRRIAVVDVAGRRMQVLTFFDPKGGFSP